MSNKSIDFDLLENIRQANIRGSRYQLKKRGKDKFTISNEGKKVIGYNETKGINLKAGNGVVVIGVLPKNDKRCTSGLLNGAKGAGFISNTLEAAIVDNDIESNFYTFEELQKYQDVMYYKLIPVKDVKESEKDASAEDYPDEPTPETEPVNDSEPVSMKGTAIESNNPLNDEF